MNLKNKRGITLIALVITIIVLLILAGVTIATLTGDNGILTKANEAKTETAKAEERDQIQLAYQSAKIREYQNIDATILFVDLFEEELEKNGLVGAIVTDNEDGSFTINFSTKGNIYYLKDNVSELKVNLYINNEKDLKEFRDRVNNGETFEGQYIQLTNNIDLNGEEWEPIGILVDSGLNVNTKPFKGIFDGNGYEIDNFQLTTSSYQCQGLFGIVINGTIKNLEVGDNCIITGNAFHTGAIVGFVFENSNIINCGNNSDINTSNNMEVGGIVGTTNVNSNIYNCYNAGEIIGTNNIGGIVGNLMDGKVMNCYNTANITASRGGGITGQSIDNSHLENCYNIGIVDVNDTVKYAGITSHTVPEENTFKNNFYLENVVNGQNDIYTLDGIESKSKNLLKSIILSLGTNYKEDIENINNTYPILNWQ